MAKKYKVVGRPRDKEGVTVTEVIIRKALLDLGMDVSDLARKIGCKQSYIYNVVKGRHGRGRKAKIIRRGIAKFLKIRYDELWANGNGSRNNG